MSIFMLNNVSVLRQELRPHSSLRWGDLLNSEAASWVEVLVREEVARTLKRSDLVTYPPSYPKNKT
jgi:hypothetical protein